MVFRPLINTERQQIIFSWASKGLLIFLFGFLWAPSRDALQIIFALAFFLPMGILLSLKKPSFYDYGGWPTIIALTYAGFSTLSTLWGASKDFLFFVLQWCVLATWLCGSNLIFLNKKIDIEKYLHWFIFLGAIITISTFAHYFIFIDAYFPLLSRFVGWNVFRNPNEIGAFCGIIALLAFTVAVQSTSMKQVWLFYLLAFIASLGLLASLSRGAFIAFTIMTIVSLLIVRPPIKIWLPPVIIASTAIILLLITTNIISSYTSGRGEGFGVRATIWKEVLDRCRENIFTGIGMSKDTTIVLTNHEDFNHAHNAWLDTLFRTGLIGLVLILLHLISILQKFFYDKNLLPFYVWLGYGCICNLVDGRCFFWEIGAKWFLYWIPAGLIVAILSAKRLTSQRGF